MNEGVEWVLWRLGWFTPALKAYVANYNIRTTGRNSVDESGRFDDAFLACWEGRLGDDQVLGQIADQIYDHEVSRREAIGFKAQSSLNATSLVIAALSFSVTILGTQFESPDVISIVVMVVALLYFFMAFILAFRAVHIHRYVAVEYDELDKLVGTGEDKASNAVARGIRARRLAAVFQNRQLTLRISNLVEASFLSLRNGILVLLISGVFILASSASEGSRLTCDELVCEAGPDDGPGSTRVPRSRYYEVWPNG